MPDYNYVDYVCLNKNIDEPKEHHNKFILNQETYFYITSLSNVTDETLTFLPNLFVNKRRFSRT